jgi:TDG/mug DNA glycosylase family protein
LDSNREIITSFAPIADPIAKVLILGSMPGVKSLEAKQYYAHKQNAFWRIMATLCGFDPHLPYAERTAYLILHHIAVWDVLHSCEREGSLDTAINAAIVNDFEAFFKQHLSIRRVCFNGAAAERYFKMHVKPGLTQHNLTYLRLPSTSPAHASMSLTGKTLAWKSGLGLDLAH